MDNSSINHKYSVQSGTLALIDESWIMRLNEWGMYELDTGEMLPTKEQLETVRILDSMLNSDVDETTVAKELFGAVKGVKFDETLGFYQSLYAGHVVEGLFRENGSSGGIATWILVELFRSGAIDGVIHLKPANSSDRVLFEYQLSTSEEEIIEGAKSRYYPGELSKSLRSIADLDGNYAVVGIPSLLYELRLLTRQNPIYKKRIAFTVGLIAGHQKTTKYADSMAWEHGIEPGNLRSIDFRKKVPGQPADRYIAEITGLIHGKEVTFTRDQDEFLVSNWGHGLFKPLFSDFTDDAFNETADIVLGDAWLPEYSKDGLGNNVVIVRNPLIAEVIESAISEGRLKLDSLEPERVIKSQSGLVHHTRDELPYRLKKIDKLGQWRPVKRVSPSSELSFLRKRVQGLRNELSQESHRAFLEAENKQEWSIFENSIRPLQKRYAQVYWLIAMRTLTPQKLVRKIKRILKRLR